MANTARVAIAMRPSTILLDRHNLGVSIAFRGSVAEHGSCLQFCCRHGRWPRRSAPPLDALHAYILGPVVEMSGQASRTAAPPRRLPRRSPPRRAYPWAQPMNCAVFAPVWIRLGSGAQ